MRHKEFPDKYYALKTLDKNEDPVQVPFFYQEIEIHKKLKHPNIIQIEGVIEDDDNIYIFMEYAKKGDLFDFMK